MIDITMTETETETGGTDRLVMNPDTLCSYMVSTAFAFYLSIPS